MDLNYTPEDIAFRKQAQTWLEQNLPKKEIANLEERRPPTSPSSSPRSSSWSSTSRPPRSSA